MRTRGQRVSTAPYPAGFTPTFHEYNLRKLGGFRAGRTVFVCSMADLFGDWVPDEWIIKVFNACLTSEARFLFLTKNPKRYERLADAKMLPRRHWYGTTVTGPEQVQVFSRKGYHTWISYEPLLGPLPEDWLAETAWETEWAVLGAETGNRAGKVVPERSWAAAIVQDYQKAGKPVFLKDSMKPVWGETLLTETPWGRLEGQT